MYLAGVALSSTLFSASVLSAAVPPHDSKITTVHRLAKRANPTIGDGINKDDPNRGGKLFSPTGTSGALYEAFELIDYATKSRDNVVFAKYFNTGDKDVVMGVLDGLLGGAITGAPELSQITVIAGEDKSENPAPAALEGFADPDPNLILTEGAWVYPNRDDTTIGCEEWEKTGGMTQDMYLLASILVHEYTHWDWFLKEILELEGGIIDQPNGYGWERARALDKSLAKYNADSYGWYVTENFWAIICHKNGGYDAPPDDDDGDDGDL